MAKEENSGSANLKPVRTKEEARIRGRNGGIASGKARAERKTLKEELLLLLSEGEVQKNLSAALIYEALNGNNKMKAFEVIRDTIGEKPVDNLKVGNDDPDKPFEVNIKVVK